MTKYVLAVGRIKAGRATIDETVLIGRSQFPLEPPEGVHPLHRQHPDSYDESGEPIPI